MLCGGGRPDDINASGTVTEGGVDDVCGVVLRYGKTLAMISCVGVMDGANTIVVQGTRGHITVHAPFWAPDRVTVVRRGANGRSSEETLVVPVPEPNGKPKFIHSSGMRFQAIAVQDAVLAGKTEAAEMPLDESVVLAETMDEIRRQLGVAYDEDADVGDAGGGAGAK